MKRPTDIPAQIAAQQRVAQVLDDLEQALGPAPPPPRALTAPEVAARLQALVASVAGLAERDLHRPDDRVQDALAALAFSHGFTRLARQVAAIRRLAAQAAHAASSPMQHRSDL